MSIIKKFKTFKVLYDWGAVYHPETGDKLKLLADSAYGKTSMAWVMTYQKSEEDIPKIIRIVFVD